MANISFSNGPSLKRKRGNVDSAVVYARYVYVSGGYTHSNNYSNPSNTVEMFDMEASTWSDVDALDQESGDQQLVLLNGKVFALGGEDKVDTNGTINQDELPELGARSEVLDTVEVLHLEDTTPLWENPHADMPTQLFPFAAATWKDGYIFVFGGQVGYDTDCKCFRTTNHVEDEAHHAAQASGGATIVRQSGSIAMALLWAI